MTIIPFVCLTVGIIIGRIHSKEKFLAICDKASTIALILLMIAIGLGIGIDDEIVSQFPRIGLNCVIISSCAIAASILFATICERTILNLSSCRLEMSDEYAPDMGNTEGTSNLVWIMPLSIILGLIAGMLVKNCISVDLVDNVFTGALIILYVCVGIGQGANKKLLTYLKALGIKVLLLPLSVFLGSIIGGLVASCICSAPMNISIISASGMSFYSITGAYMTQTYGVAMGTYGFIVNVLREFITIVTMPALIKIGKAAPIAGGAAGDMDTMLAPVTKFVGIELGMVTLLTGTILTFIVPLILPVLTLIFG